MSQPVQVVRQSKVGFNEFGQSTQTDEAFMQFFVSFITDGSLRRLKGAPLSAFIAIGLHEAEILLGNSAPFTLSDIMRVTGYSKPVMVAALDTLVAGRFVTELAERGTCREKQYRIAAYMHFGVSRNSRSKDSLLLVKSKKTFPHDDDVHILDSGSKDNHHHHDVTAARNIFAEVGFEGVNLVWLAEHVTPGLAATWARWVKSAPRELYRNPHGYCWTFLKADSNAEPPALPEQMQERRPLRRENFNDAEWSRISEANRQRILSGEMF